MARAARLTLALHRLGGFDGGVFRSLIALVRRDDSALVALVCRADIGHDGSSLLNVERGDGQFGVEKR